MFYIADGLESVYSFNENYKPIEVNYDEYSAFNATELSFLMPDNYVIKPVLIPNKQYACHSKKIIPGNNLEDDKLVGTGDNISEALADAIIKGILANVILVENINKEIESWIR